MPSRRQLLAAAGLLGGAALTGCGRKPAREGADPDALHIRVWSETAAAAYRTALEGFTSSSGLAVEVEAMAWEDYWTAVPLDIAGGSAPDLLWMNTANLAQLQANDDLMDVGEILGDDAGAIDPVLADQYRIDDRLWGAPQYWDRTVLLANRSMTDAAGADPAGLRFDPGAPSDPLRDAARAMTRDAAGLAPDEPGYDQGTGAWGIGTGPDRAALLGPFIAGSGGRWQEDDGAFAFASAQGIAAVQYLADLALRDRVTPPAADLVADRGLSRQRFTEGRLGLLQTGTYALEQVRAGVAGAFPWSVHPALPGPEGERPLVHAIALAAVSTKDEDRTAAVAELLRHLVSADGARPLAQQRVGIPARSDLRETWVQAWGQQEVDVSALAQMPGRIAQPETGLRAAEGVDAALGPISEVFRGEAPASETLPVAQEKANAARG